MLQDNILSTRHIQYARAAPQAPLWPTLGRQPTKAVRRGRILVCLDRRPALLAPMVTIVLVLQAAAQAVAVQPVTINLARVFVDIALLGNIQTLLDRQAAPRVRQENILIILLYMTRQVLYHARAAPLATMWPARGRQPTSAVRRGRTQACLGRQPALRVQLVTQVLNLQAAAQAAAVQLATINHFP